MSRNRILPVLLAYLSFVSVYAQPDTLCPNVNIVNDQPILTGEYDAFYGVFSRGYVGENQEVDMHASELVELDSGFEVKPLATFHAYIEGCNEDCVESLPLCKGDPCTVLSGEVDLEGNLYSRNQILITYHNSLPENPVEFAILKSYLDQITNVNTANSSVKECTCGANILIYESTEPINAEGTIIQANTSGGPNDEGIYFGLNYYVQPDILDIPTSTNGSPGMNQAVLNRLANNNQTPIVAFLDTGIDYNLLPDEILLNEVTNCFNGTDAFGWNFIDNNNNIFDNRGHGTGVVMAYLNTLKNEGVPLNSQRILPVKVLDDCGRGTIFSVICGMYYAKEKGASIINNSWGIYNNNLQLQETVIDLDENCNIRMVCSAGNLNENLDQTEHFPSGYSNIFSRILPDGSTVIDTGLDNVFEVGGLCHGLEDPPITSGTINLWPSTNYRRYMWVEPSIDVQEMINAISIVPLNPPIVCGINGTSYAAPQLTAGVLDYLLSNGSLPNQNQMIPVGRNVSSSDYHYSYTQR